MASPKHQNGQEVCYGCNGTGRMACVKVQYANVEGPGAQRKQITTVYAVCLYCEGTGWLPNGTKKRNLQQQRDYWCRCYGRQPQSELRFVPNKYNHGQYDTVQTCLNCGRVTALQLLPTDRFVCGATRGQGSPCPHNPTGG